MSNFIDEIKYMWKGKLIVTILATLFFIVPCVLSEQEIPAKTWVVIVLGFPILIWLSITYNLGVYGKDLKENDESNSGNK